MKIGFDVSATCGNRSGVGWYSDRLVRAMAEQDLDHEYFLYHRFDRRHDGDPSLGTQIEGRQAVIPWKNQTADQSAALWEELREGKEIEHQPDIVHATSFQAPPLNGTRLIYTVYDVTFWVVPEYTFEENRFFSQQGTLDAMRNASGFVFISESARNEFERVFPGWLRESGMPNTVTLLASNETAMPPAVDREDTESSYWLFVGSLEPRKNISGILDALDLYWEKSSDPKPLKIAGGEGCETDKLRWRIADRASKGMVERLNYVPEERMSQLYAEATAFLFPSWYEGFGLPVLEAMTEGCPVITSDNTSLPEVGGDAVLYVDPESPESLAEAMLRLERDEALRHELASKGLKRAQIFSWEKTARETLAFYEEVLEKSNP